MVRSWNWRAHFISSLLLGILKLADFGLAREYHEHKVFTSVVSDGSVSICTLTCDILGRDHVVSSPGDSARITLLYLSRHVEYWLYPRRDGSWSTAILCSIGEPSTTSHHSVRHKALFAINDSHDILCFIFSKFFSLMGLPNEDEWPVESPIGREAFENCPRPVITLERLVRFQDTCAFELLRVSFFHHSFSTKKRLSLIRSCFRSNKAIVHPLFAHSNITSFVERIIARAQLLGLQQTLTKRLLRCLRSMHILMGIWSVATTTRRSRMLGSETVRSIQATSTISRGHHQMMGNICWQSIVTEAVLSVMYLNRRSTSSPGGRIALKRHENPLLYKLLLFSSSFSALRIVSSHLFSKKYHTIER